MSDKKLMGGTSCAPLKARHGTFSGKTLVRRPADSEGSSDELERGTFGKLMVGSHWR